MKKTKLAVQGIPAILWGESANQLFIAVHGNLSCKDDEPIAILAEEAFNKGYQTLSFDLPEHGDRRDIDYLCKVQNCITDLTVIAEYARTISSNISLFACSMGAYFSLIAYKDLPLKQCLFLSPVLNMERIINNMMSWFDVSEDRLKAEKEIATPIGQTLYWDYYSYVKVHPIDRWDIDTAILYGTNDDISEFNVISDFTEKHHCKLEVLEQGEHYFHTEEQLAFFKRWLNNNIY